MYWCRAIYINIYEFRAVFYFIFYPLLLAFVVGGLGFEFCVFVAGWRHALRKEWPFIIINIIIMYIEDLGLGEDVVV